MNFGDILRDWEDGRKDATPGPEHRDFEALLDAYPPKGSKDSDVSDPSGSAPTNRDLRNRKHDAVLDLHGMTLTQAEAATDRFLVDAHTHGFAKVLIVHGKGTHSPSAPVLRDGIRRFLERHRFAGRLDVPPAKYGGRGALWVMIR